MLYIDIYTIATYLFCKSVKILLVNKSVKFNEIVIYVDCSKYKEIIKRSKKKYRSTNFHS